MGAAGLIILTLLVLLAAWLCGVVMRWIFVGAEVRLEKAADHGGGGLIVYVACWILMFPLMLVMCGLLGLNARIIERMKEQSVFRQPSVPRARRPGAR